MGEDMKRWRVELRRTSTQRAFVEVEAEDEYAAEQAAVDLVYAPGNSVEFDHYDGLNDGIVAGGAEALEPAP